MSGFFGMELHGGFRGDEKSMNLGLRGLCPLSQASKQCAYYQYFARILTPQQRDVASNGVLPDAAHARARRTFSDPSPCPLPVEWRGKRGRRIPLGWGGSRCEVWSWGCSPLPFLVETEKRFDDFIRFSGFRRGVWLGAGVWSAILWGEIHTD